MSLIPESGKPIDFDRSNIKTAKEAAVVLKWLDDLIVDMQYQILQHLTESTLNLDWLAKVRSALRATIKLRAQVAEMRVEMERAEDEGQRAILFVQAASKLFEHDDLQDVWKEVDKRLSA